MAFLLVPISLEPSTANNHFSLCFLLCFRFLLFVLAVSSLSSKSTSTPSSSPGNLLHSLAGAHLSAKVYNSLRVLGSRTFILVCILLLHMFERNTGIIAAGCISGMFMCTRLYLCIYFRKLSPSLCGRICRSLGRLVLGGRA